ncbi:MAG: tripartite tricarboxylate transporter substrate binding protein [Pseudomonadota bacterium]
MTPSKPTAIGAALALGLAALSPLAFGQAYPNKPVRIVVPFPPGGTVDAVARALAARLSEQMGQPFVVENRAGANGSIGADAVAKSAPDGYTLLVHASTVAAVPLLVKNVPYNLERDFTPITNLGAVPLIVTAYPGLPFTNLKDFLAAAKADPRRYTFGTSALGSASHLAEEAIKYGANVDIQVIAYKGTGPALVDVMGGHTSAMVDAVPSTMSHIKSGKLRPLAVTSATRLASLPDVPTVAESGLKGFEMVSWYGLWGPAKMPAELTARIHKQVILALNSQQIAQSLGSQSFAVSNTTSQQFGAYVKQESAKYKQLIDKANIRIDQ